MLLVKASAVGVLLLSLPVQAQEARPFYVDGATLYAVCSDPSAAQERLTFCNGYIIGIYDFLFAFSHGCRSNVPASQVREAVTQALTSQPDLQTLPAAFVVALELTERFGCNVEQK